MMMSVLGLGSAPAAPKKSATQVRDSLIPVAGVSLLIAPYIGDGIDLIARWQGWALSESARDRWIVLVLFCLVWIRQHFKVRRIEFGPFTFDPGGFEQTHTTIETDASGTVKVETVTAKPVVTGESNAETK